MHSLQRKNSSNLVAKKKRTKARYDAKQCWEKGGFTMQGVAKNIISIICNLATVRKIVLRDKRTAVTLFRAGGFEHRKQLNENTKLYTDGQAYGNYFAFRYRDPRSKHGKQRIFIKLVTDRHFRCAASFGGAFRTDWPEMGRHRADGADPGTFILREGGGFSRVWWKVSKR